MLLVLNLPLVGLFVRLLNVPLAIMLFTAPLLRVEAQGFALTHRRESPKYVIMPQHLDLPSVIDIGQIDPSLRVPHYVQVKRQLLALIERGDAPEGTMLPTEAQLQHHFGVSRTTVRQAMAELSAQGYVTRRAGKGTFVAARRIADQRPRRLVGFVEALHARGVDVQSQVLGIDRGPATPKVAGYLDVAHGRTVVRILHRSLTEGEPIATSRIYLRCPHTTVADDISRSGGVLAFLRAHWQDAHADRFTHAIRTTTATLATAEEGGLLGMPAGSPLVMVTLQIFAAKGPAVYLEAVYRADRYKYEEHLDV